MVANAVLYAVIEELQIFRLKFVMLNHLSGSQCVPPWMWIVGAGHQLVSPASTRYIHLNPIHERFVAAFAEAHAGGVDAACTVCCPHTAAVGARGGSACGRPRRRRCPSDSTCPCRGCMHGSDGGGGRRQDPGSNDADAIYPPPLAQAPHASQQRWPRHP